MSKVIAIAIFVIVGFAGVRFAAYYKEVNRRVEEKNNQWEQPVVVAPVVEPGMASQLEPLLETAKNKGAAELKKWLDQYRGYVKEPRLSEIELDYVLMVGRSDPPEARRVFASIRQRNGADSPLLDRINKMAKTYE